jgi:hypothetical protein
VINFDIVNSVFALLGALAIGFNIKQLHIDKLVRGVHLMPIVHFLLAGVDGI